MIEKITTVEAGVRKLLDLRGRPVPDFRIEPRPAGEFHDILVWNGQRIPLFDTHFDARLYRMTAYGAEADKNCTLNVYSFEGCDVPPDDLVYRELDIAELLLHSPLRKVTAFSNGAAVDLIAVMENTCCANIDLGCTMAPGSVNQCQHRLITQHGMACDRGAGDMVASHELYVFGQGAAEPVIYNDDEYYLYGLDDRQVARVLAIHAILTAQKYPGRPEGAPDFWTEWAARDVRLKKGVAAVRRSAETGCTVSLEEVSACA